MNLANNDLKRTQFKFSYTICVPIMESNLSIIGLDYSEIQGGFQDIFSYMVETFKKYGDSLSQIYHYSQKIESAKEAEKNQDIKMNGKSDKKTQDISPLPQINAKLLYKDIQKNGNNFDSNDYTQFLIQRTSKLPRYLIMPKSYISKTFGSRDEYEKEKEILTYLRENIDECYHIKVNESNLEVLYPDYKGCTLINSIKNLSNTGITAIQTFKNNLDIKQIKVINYHENESIAKIDGAYSVYFSRIPFMDYIFLNQTINKNDQIEDELIITKEIYKSIKSKPEEVKKISFINEEDFDSINYETLEGYLIDSVVKLSPITMEEIEKLESLSKRNLGNICTHIGYIEKNNQYYLVEEKLEKIYNENMTAAEIAKYFNQLISNLILLKAVQSDNKDLFIITEEDLFINYKGTLKIKYREYSEHFIWRSFRKDKNPEEKLVYSLSMLLFKLFTKHDPFEKLSEYIPKEELLADLINEHTRYPIFQWEFEMSNPKIVSFLRLCWNYEINSLKAMKNKFPPMEFDKNMEA